uniref:Putative papain-like cysteine prorease n=1 Tax=Plasmodium chabaudi chabaudi TaxID=31271 RepID=A0A0E4B3T6_PLACU|nr:putative papain-like cysteine prorease [Plasmodium chabaudi chabaudi]
MKKCIPLIFLLYAMLGNDIINCRPVPEPMFSTHEYDKHINGAGKGPGGNTDTTTGKTTGGTNDKTQDTGKGTTNEKISQPESEKDKAPENSPDSSTLPSPGSGPSPSSPESSDSSNSSDSSDPSASTDPAKIPTEDGKGGTSGTQPAQQPQPQPQPQPQSQGSENPPPKANTDTVNTNQTLSVTEPTANNTQVVAPKNVQTGSVESALLKNFNGVKVTGACGDEAAIFLEPYIYINIDSKNTNINLSANFSNLFGQHITVFDGTTPLHNVCHEEDDSLRYKMLIYLQDDILTIKWSVFPSNPESNTCKHCAGHTNENENVDVKKFRLPRLPTPLTTIQVHSLLNKEDKVIIRSKDYALKNEMPKKCDQVASKCFLNGQTDIEQCYTCSLLTENIPTTDECYNYSSPLVREYTQVLTTAQSDEDNVEKNNTALVESINNLLNGVYKVDEHNNKVLIDEEELSNDLKKELTYYCQVLSEIDTSGTLENYKVGNSVEIFNNLAKLLKNHENENKLYLINKLKNPAICMKDVEQWVVNRKGLKLPVALDDAEKKTDNAIKFEEGPDGIVDLTKTVDGNPITTTAVLANKLDAFCNNEFCDRLNDKTSCISNINVEEQGNCATSWVFASKLHLESSICMKGYDHTSASALYVANCSKKDSKDKCLAGSNPLEFIDILQTNNYLPTESNYPYNYKNVGDACPETNESWVNLFDKVKLEDSNKDNKSIIKGYKSYESKNYKTNMNEFVDIVKNNIKKLGSVIAYVKFNDSMGYDFNGSKVHKLCGSATPDMAVNIIGYGKYINENNEVKSYWLVRNSWGKHWADEGNFKVDIETPEDCEDNFIHTALVFDLDLPVVAKNTNEAPIYNYYLKTSPSFYKNLYYNHVNKTHGEVSDDAAIYGQAEPEAPGKNNQSGSTTDTTKVTTANSESGSDAGGKTTQTTEGPTEQQVTDSTSTQKQGSSATPGVSGPTSPGTAGKDGETNNVAGGSAGQSPPAPVTTQSPSNPASGVTGEQSTPTPGNNGEQADEAAAETDATQNTEVFHVLKVVRNKKVQTSLLKYGTYTEMGQHSCARAMSTDPTKKEECVAFCNNNWDDCYFDLYPGYCLNKLKGDNVCNFCAV